MGSHRKLWKWRRLVFSFRKDTVSPFQRCNFRCLLDTFVTPGLQCLAMCIACVGNLLRKWSCSFPDLWTNLFKGSPRWWTVKFLQVSPLKVEEFSAKMFLEAVGGWSDWPLAFLLGLYTHPWKMNGCWNPKSWKFGWKMTFMFNWMIFRFQPVIFTNLKWDVKSDTLEKSFETWIIGGKKIRKKFSDVIICPSFFVWLVEGRFFFAGEKLTTKNSDGLDSWTFRWDKFVPKRRRRTVGIYNRCFWLPCCVQGVFLIFECFLRWSFTDSIPWDSSRRTILSKAMYFFVRVLFCWDFLGQNVAAFILGSMWKLVLDVLEGG